MRGHRSRPAAAAALGAFVLLMPAGPAGADAVAPPSGAASTATAHASWSFRKPVRPPLPPVHRAGWLHNPIDAFVLARLEAAGLAPAPPADKRALIRRVTLDLTGLPTTPDDVEAFLADDAADAYDRLVDRLLASPQYGERWARAWLDLARYAESDGFKTDGTRPNAWRYRDYVIDSFNQDKPYDRFVREQIAGDEIDPENAAARIATGFNRHWPDEDNARNLVLRRQEILNDITDTTASVFLGITLGCARCHDHKFDPLLQTDYYRFQAFFAAAQPSDAAAGTAADQATYRAGLSAWEAASASIRSEMEAIEQPVRQKMRQETVEKFVPEVQEALAVAQAERTPLQRQLACMAEQHLEITTETMMGRMQKDQRERWTELRDGLKKFDSLKPPELPVAMGITDAGAESPRTFLLIRGNYTSPGEEVQPGFLSVFDPGPASLSPPAPGRSTTGRRTVLANWIASAENPLAARVVVNRLWQGHFGRGIVATPSDFGRQGDPPSHPELLDWLATELVVRGWSLKAMHRLMVTSNAYCQSSNARRATDALAFSAAPASSEAGIPHAAPAVTGSTIDPDNRLLWRMNRRRLEGEAIRDAMLATGGALNPALRGRSVYPELPPGISDRYGWKPSQDAAERNRRSIYVFVRRNLRYPLFEVFDMPDTNETCGRRNQTTTAPQALYVLNSELILSQARAFAGRVLRETAARAGSGTVPADALVDRAYRLALGRPPSADEAALASRFLTRQTDLVRGRNVAAAELAVPERMPEGYDPAAGAALTDFCHALLNANEFVYVD